MLVFGLGFWGGALAALWGISNGTLGEDTPEQLMWVGAIIGMVIVGAVLIAGAVITRH